MRHLIYIVLGTIVALAIWTGVFLAGTLEGWWRKPLAPKGDPAAFMAAVTQMIDEESQGNLAFTLIQNGKVFDSRFRSVGRPVDGETLFQVASLSKWLTALGVMTLVDAGQVDLDAPVDTYLKRWKLPPSAYDNREVTVRRVLSHTGGLTDGLGYAGFAPGTPIQGLPESLTRAADASPGRDGAVVVGQQPGKEWKYSGGGYTLLQLMIEDVTGQSFDAYMRRAVLGPFGMTRSAFILPDDAQNVAEFFDVGGKPATHYRFTATGAASLYTSAADLTRLIQAHLPGPEGEPPGRGVLRPQTLRDMRKPHASQLGADIWGLGVILYAPNGSGDYVVGHDGDNEPAINTSARFDPKTGDGIVVLETGTPLLATKLAGEWVFWNVGAVDNLMVAMEGRKIFVTLAAGWLLIVLLGIAVGWRTRPRKAVTT